MEDPRIAHLLLKRDFMQQRGNDRHVARITEQLAALGYVEPGIEE